MGISIGSAVRAVAATLPVGPVRSQRSPASTVPDSTQDARLVREPEAPPITAGFGENSLSPSGAALRTLDRNLKAARRLVPTVEQLRDQARFNQAQRADAIESGAERDPAVEVRTEREPAREARSEELRQRELVRPEPNSAARNFVSDTGSPATADRSATGAVNPPDRTSSASGQELASARLDVRV